MIVVTVQIVKNAWSVQMLQRNLRHNLRDFFQCTSPTRKSYSGISIIHTCRRNYKYDKEHAFKRYQINYNLKNKDEPEFKQICTMYLTRMYHANLEWFSKKILKIICVRLWSSEGPLFQQRP